MQPPGPKRRGPFRRWVVLRGERDADESEPAPSPSVPPAAASSRGPDIVDRSPSVDELEAEARYQRNRLSLYRQRILTGKPTTPQRLREIERAMESARERLRRARRRPSDAR